MTPEGTTRDSALLPLMGLSQLKTNSTKSFYESHCPMHTGSEVSLLTAVLPASPRPPAHARCCPSPKSPPIQPPRPATTLLPACWGQTRSAAVPAGLGTPPGGVPAPHSDPGSGPAPPGPGRPGPGEGPAPGGGSGGGTQGPKAVSGIPVCVWGRRGVLKKAFGLDARRKPGKSCRFPSLLFQQTLPRHCKLKRPGGKRDKRG